MRRRWFGVVLMAWAILVPFLLYAPAPALAADDEHTFLLAWSVGAKLVQAQNLNGTLDCENDLKKPLEFLCKLPDGTSTNVVVTPPDYTAGTVIYSTGVREPVVIQQGEDLKAFLAANNFNPNGTPKTPPPPATGDDTVDCDAGPGFTWIVCGVIKLLIGVIDTIRNDVIVPSLREPPLDKDQPEFKDAFKIWTVFRNIASIFFILIFFLTIIGTALGRDNYTIKKVLPRLVAGAILVPFSWYLCGFIIDIGNVLGQGIIGIVASAGIKPKVDFTTSMASYFGLVPLAGGAAAAWVLAGAGATAGAGAIITMLIAFLGVFVTLVLRKIIILMCVVVSPFALLAWILPNTEKYFKTWRENFIKLVLMYPIIMLLFEAGRLFSATAGAASGGGAGASWVAPLFALAGLIVPLFAVPWAFKFAGTGLAAGAGALGRVSGGADKQFGKGSDFAKDRAENRTRNSVEKAKKAEYDAKQATPGFRKAMLQRKAALNWQRAGMGSGLTGRGSANDAVKLRRSAATGKAAEELGTIDAEARQGQEGRSEDFRNRRRATGETILKKKSEERGAREGVLMGADGAGGASNRALEWQNAAKYNSRDDYLAQTGQAQGRVNDERLNNAALGTSQYVSSQTKLEASKDRASAAASEKRSLDLGTVNGANSIEDHIAAELVATTGMSAAAAKVEANNIRMRNLGAAKALHEQEHVIEASQTATTTVTANKELDAEMQHHAGGSITLAQAHQMRMENLARSTHTKTREGLGATEGEIDQRLATQKAAGGQEKMSQLVGAGAIAAGEKYATERMLRQKRVELQASAKGHMTDQETLKAAGIDAGNRLSTSVGASKQALAQEASDYDRAFRDGDLAAAPTLDNKVMSAIEQSKDRTSKESATRIANATAARNGTAASTRDYTDVALADANRDTATRNATLQGGAGVVRSGIQSSADKILATSGRPNTPVNQAWARREAVSRNLAGIAATTRQDAGVAMQTKISTDEGNNDDYENAINDEIIDVQAAATAAGSALPPDIARQRAEANFQNRTLEAASGAARGKARTARRETREEMVGGLENREADIAAELEKQGAADPANPTEQELADANLAVTRRGLAEAGANAREQGAQNARVTGNQKAGVKADVDDREQEELDKQQADPATRIADPVAARKAAAATSRRTALEAVGKKANKEAARSNRNKVKEAIGGENTENVQVEDEIDAMLTDPANAGRTREQLRTTARSNILRTNLRKGGQAAEIAGQKAAIDIVAKDKGVIDAYGATLKQAPIEQARNAADRAAYDASQQKAADEAEAHAINEAINAGTAAPSAAKINELKEQARKDNKKEAINAGAKAGEIARLAAIAAPASAAEQQRAIIQNQGKAMQEQTMRSENTAAAQTNAYTQAVTAGGALDAEQRLAAQTENAAASLANESAGARARYELTRPGQDMHQTYQQAEAEETELKQNAIYKERTDAALEEDVEYREAEYEAATRNTDGTPLLDLNGEPIMLPTGKFKTIRGKLKNSELNGDSIPAFEKQARIALGQELTPDGELDYEGDGITPKMGQPKNVALGLALMSRMSVTGKGIQATDRIQKELFGRTDERVFDPSKFNGQAGQLWEQVRNRNNSDRWPTSTAPSAAVSDGMTTDTFSNMNYAALGTHFDYVNRTGQDNLIGETNNNIIETLTNSQRRTRMSDDHYQQMWLYLQNPKARDALANKPQGAELIRQINERATRANVQKKWSYEPIPGPTTPTARANVLREKREEQVTADALRYIEIPDPTASYDPRTATAAERDARRLTFITDHMAPGSDNKRPDFLGAYLAQSQPQMAPAVSDAILSAAGNDPDYLVELTNQAMADPVAFGNLVVAGTLPTKTGAVTTGLPNKVLAKLKKDASTAKTTVDAARVKKIADRWASGDTAYQDAIKDAILNNKPIPDPNT